MEIADRYGIIEGLRERKSTIQVEPVMRVEIDQTHVELVEQAIANGRAADPQSYLQSLIDEDAAEQWVNEHPGEIEELLRGRLSQLSIERHVGDFEALRRRVLTLVEQKRNRRTA